jgi:hypothetical protein
VGSSIIQTIFFFVIILPRRPQRIMDAVVRCRRPSRLFAHGLTSVEKDVARSVAALRCSPSLSGVIARGTVGYSWGDGCKWGLIVIIESSVELRSACCRRDRSSTR